MHIVLTGRSHATDFRPVGTETVAPLWTETMKVLEKPQEENARRACIKAQDEEVDLLDDNRD